MSTEVLMNYVLLSMLLSIVELLKMRQYLGLYILRSCNIPIINLCFKTFRA